MIARECAAQMARQIVRALHITAAGAGAVAVTEASKRKPVKSKKKRKAK